MRFFLDSSNVAEIKKWHATGIVGGITTNPTIMLKDGAKTVREAYHKITDVVGNVPISLEVTSDDRGVALEQAWQMHSWGPNVVVKVPIVAQNGTSMLETIHLLSQRGVSVNCTAMLSMGQLMGACLAGARYLSLFLGRVSDEGGDAAALTRRCRQWLDAGKEKGEIIAGSMRSAIDVQIAAEAGAHIITVPPQILVRVMDHRYSRDTVLQFLNDARGVPLDGTVPVPKG